MNNRIRFSHLYLIIFLTFFSMRTLNVRAEILKNYYVLPGPQLIGCGSYNEYRLPIINTKSKREALALYQIFMFAYGGGEAPNQELGRQFGLTSNPNHILINKYNNEHGMLPYSYGEMATALNAEFQNNNPYNLQSYFRTELDKEDQATARALTLVSLDRDRELIEGSIESDSPESLEKYRKKIDMILAPLIKKYHIQIVTLPDEGVDCE